MKSNRCRGFGERRGACRNPPGTRTVNDGRGVLKIPSLCSTCDDLRVRTGQDIAIAEGRPENRRQPRPRGEILGLTFKRLDTGMTFKVRRSSSW